jgi:formamidopyrimidine-DNA glycosylase
MMPELPEVETIVRGLAPVLTGRTFVDVFILDPRSVLGDDIVFQRDILGRRVTAVRRRGKLVVCELEGDLVLAVHLKMTGRLWFTPPETSPHSHTTIAFFLDSSEQLFFDDQRRFGYCAVFSRDGLRQWDYWATLGPDPLQIAEEDLAGRIQGRRAAVKGLLLNQRIVSGVGNIYADESLHRAGIHPASRAVRIGWDRLVFLFRCLRQVLEEAVDAGGSSIRDYRGAFGEHGRFQQKFAVYGRAGKPCPVCKELLCKTVVAGRTSTFCPACQPLLR